jgi:ABC-type phosphate transport system substrate-binding protein
MMSIKTFVAATAAFAMTSVPAMAQSWWWWWGGSRGGTTTTTTTTTPASVPEIDGSTAVLAVAAILAALAFAWERNRRRA